MNKIWNRIGKHFIFILFFLYAMISLYPLIWVVIQSFKTETEFLQSIWTLPKSLNLRGYSTAFTTGKLLQYFKNTAIVTICSVLVEIVFITMASFAFSKLKMKFRNFFFYFILLNMLIPTPVILMPMYIQVLNMHIQNTLPAMVFPYFQGMAPLGLVLVSGYMDNIPDEIIEAARIDGAGTGKILLQMILPLVKPILVTLAILGGMGAWNEYLWAMVSISDNSRTTLSVGIAILRDQTASIGYTPVFAALTLSASVFVILYICMQKTFVRSITSGAVKS